VGATGFSAGSEVPVFSKTYTQNGTWTGLALVLCPGEVAALVRWNTAARSSKNHPIYCFNYFHGVGMVGSGSEDLLQVAQKTLFETYATNWITGFSDGTNTYVRATPRGAGATSRVVSPYLTHRDFPK
jgi:hypothetical protein